MADVIIVYSTRSKSTEKMAKAISEGVANGGVEVKVYSLRKNVFEDFKEELKKAKAILIGTPTHDYRPAYDVDILLSKMEELDSKGKIGAVFGSYGWSGEAVYEVQNRMKKLGFELIAEPLRIIEDPDEKGLERCRQLGLMIAERVKVG